MTTFALRFTGQVYVEASSKKEARAKFRAMSKKEILDSIGETRVEENEVFGEEDG